MTKEELEKEAEQYAVENWEHYEEGQTDYKALKQAYLDCAEPREKRIAELATRCNELFLQTMQLSKAKEIIKTFLAIVNNDVEYVQNPQDCKDLWKELCEKAEQFIKDSEVEK